MYRTMLLAALFSAAVCGAADADPDPGPPVAPDPAPAPPPPPPPAPVPVAPTPAARDDVDLSSLGLDTNGGGGFDDKLNIYGFADFSWQNEQFAHKSPYAASSTTFMLGNLNLYFSKNLTPKWRSLAEIRFMAAPNASTNPDGTTTVTTALDVTNFERPVQWGTILIERAYVEYDVTDYLTIRAGHWLTPYGIWNIDHGSPVIVGTFRPYMIGQELIPEHQTGLDLFGSKAVGDYKVGYHATISNGRSETEMVQDTDRRPAFGGRLEFEAPWAGTLKLGVSGYSGRATGATTSTTVAPIIDDERSIAADAQWNHGGLLLQAEAIAHHITYLDGHRPLDDDGAPQVDGNELGAYALIGYRFHTLWNVMPFAIVEDYHPLQEGVLGNARGLELGLNFRPTPSVVLKLEWTHADIGYGDTGLLRDDVTQLSSQAAWVF